MARADVVVLGAGIVGTSVALQLVKRGLSVALIDRRGPGEETSYGNAGIIESDTLFPPAFPRRLDAFLRVVLKRAPEANYHWNALPSVAPWLLAFRANSTPERLAATARAMRPLFAQALPEHEILMRESGAERYLRRTGWLKLYRDESTYASLAPEFALAQEFGLRFTQLDTDGARALEPALAPVFRRAVHWSGVCTLTNPLAVTQAYARQFSARGGVFLNADARGLHRSGRDWRLDTEAGPLDSGRVVVALGPWAMDLLRPLGLRLPLGVKRGYHWHFRARGEAKLGRTVLDTDRRYVLAPMEQGIRITTGAEFARRDAPPTPVQFARLLPSARELFPLDGPAEPKPWLGSRPSFPDSRPVIGEAPGIPGLWLAIGHAHWGLTLGPATGRLLGEMMTGETPFTDPAPFSAKRFAR